MAEFCPECLRKMEGKKAYKYTYEVSDDLDLCEGCGKYKHVVVMRHKSMFDISDERCLALLFVLFCTIIGEFVKIYEYIVTLFS